MKDAALFLCAGCEPSGDGPEGKAKADVEESVLPELGGAAFFPEAVGELLADGHMEWICSSGGAVFLPVGAIVDCCLWDGFDAESGECGMAPELTVVVTVDGDFECFGGVAFDYLPIDEKADGNLSGVAVFRLAGFAFVILVVDGIAEQGEERGGFFMGVENEVDALNEAGE